VSGRSGANERGIACRIGAARSDADERARSVVPMRGVTRFAAGRAVSGRGGVAGRGMARRVGAARRDAKARSRSVVLVRGRTRCAGAGP
jgi:hypothetical protein